MPISDLPDRDLAKMTSQQIADLALAADRRSRELHSAGNHAAARRWDLESARLAAVLHR